ncbi:GD12479 [Drosophila simulans]|uniref:GD12479 n=1 Tax=Drosophila simulans TaxID=7240 RepID=B4QME1_DROSI|nr:GD12479 [Drosophila simulans]
MREAEPSSPQREEQSLPGILASASASGSASEPRTLAGWTIKAKDRIQTSV